MVDGEPSLTLRGRALADHNIVVVAAEMTTTRRADVQPTTSMSSKATAFTIDQLLRPQLHVPSAGHRRLDERQQNARDGAATADCRRRTGRTRLNFHGTSFPRSILVTSSPGMSATSRACMRRCYEDATRKLLSWNLGLSTLNQAFRPI